MKSLSDSVCNLSDTRESGVHEPAADAKRVMMKVTDRHFQITREMVINDDGGAMNLPPFRRR